MAILDENLKVKTVYTYFLQLLLEIEAFAYTNILTSLPFLNQTRNYFYVIDKKKM